MPSPFIVGLTLYREPHSYLKMPYACYREIRWAIKLILSRFSNTNGVSGRIRSVDHRSESGARRLKTNIKEIRDPIHNFIHVDRDEVELIDSRPFQRLRHIHQLALTHLVYPAASHKRFEHSLGVMELAGRAFDAITDRENVDEQARALFPKITQSGFLGYWRKVLRIAALCHDLGHPPYSHAAEKELFPHKFTHE